jgi:two-component system osmolarity sensor histidine kinase EnvZ
MASISGQGPARPISLKRLWRLTLAKLGDLASFSMPKGLYARALIIIIAPIVLLESVIAFMFMERHWESVTRRLSEATAGNVGALIDSYENYKGDDDYRQLITMARERMQLSLQLLPAGDLPPARPKPFFDILDRNLSAQIRKQIDKPFWLDTVGRSKNVEIRIKLSNAVMRIVAPRGQTYASNSHIFLIWMVGTALVLLTVAILFLRNQIKPILRLAEAADAFGKGRPVPEDFRPRGAREVRQAANAFIEMRDRIERHVEQRTTMLAGVSHDLRTILTRFKLQLAMLDDNADTRALKSDVDEMQMMLEDYMAFAKGGRGEEARPVDARALVEEIRDEAARFGKPIEIKLRRRKKSPVSLRRHGFKRAVANLVSNAARYADRVVITLHQDKHWLKVEVDDNGPGIAADKRDLVFRPFYRLDDARTVDLGNSGLGLAIARDIARNHGGDIELADSPLGGLKAIVSVPI